MKLIDLFFLYLNRFMWSATNCFMEIFRSLKPVVAKIKRVAIGGGSDIALACDVTFIETTAKIGYPPSVHKIKNINS
jgi:enoyl-CoA hydratase